MAMKIKIIAPRNLPFTICQTLNGLVNNNSKVPNFRSSEKLFIVTAGIKKIKIQGESVKKGVKSAKPEFIILYCPSKIHKNNPLIIKKIAITR